MDIHKRVLDFPAFIASLALLNPRGLVRSSSSVMRVTVQSESASFPILLVCEQHSSTMCLCVSRVHTLSMTFLRSVRTTSGILLRLPLLLSFPGFAMGLLYGGLGFWRTELLLGYSFSSF